MVLNVVTMNFYYYVKRLRQKSPELANPIMLKLWTSYGSISVDNNPENDKFPSYNLNTLSENYKFYKFGTISEENKP